MTNRRNSGRDRTREATNVFGLLLEATRRNHPTLTQSELGRSIGRSGGTITNYETGASFPSQSDAEELSRQLKTDLMPAWYEAKKERDEVKRLRRAKKAKVSSDPMPLQSPAQQIIALIQAEGHLIDLPPERIKRLENVINNNYPMVMKEKARREKRKKK